MKRPALRSALLALLLSACTLDESASTASTPQHLGVDDCARCHQDRYTSGDFSHEAIGLTGDCADCHDDDSWIFRRPFDHGFWPLRDRHAEARCLACHVGALTTPPARTCLPCHEADRLAARPDHTGIAPTCEDCHSTAGWRPSLFDHSARFLIDGAHLELACARCHVNEIYLGTPRACVGCHEADAANAQPDHGRFSSRCEECHNTTAWKPSNFNHDQFFPLVGAHQRVDCVECHPRDRYAGTPRECIGCHAEDRLNLSPDHARFPLLCGECHNQDAWKPWDVYHIFPVNHRSNERCEDCHSDAPSFERFYCTSCHEQGEMDREHRRMGRYRYDNEECFRCHPRGRE
ncbi:hypothetical protein KKF91_02300 [Myxococcota bacterium]|nr:hypothetical protein [Myxococcota bacterium]